MHIAKSSWPARGRLSGTILHAANICRKNLPNRKGRTIGVVEEKKVKENNKAIRLYLLLLFTVCYGLGIIELLTNTGKAYEFLRIGFTFFQF